MGRGFAGDVERGESAALLGRDASTSGGYDDEHGVDGDGGAGWMTHATDGVLGSSSSTSNRKTRERARDSKRLGGRRGGVRRGVRRRRRGLDA